MKSISIDLHGFTSAEAKSYLLNELKKCPKNVTEIEVIHGCNGGQALLKMVRGFSHPRIERKILGMNNGITIFVLTNTTK